MPGTHTTPSRLEVVHRHNSIFNTPAPGPDLSGLERIGQFCQAEIYASESLVAEVETIRRLGGLAYDGLYHATSSIALSALSKHKAILSSKQLLAEGEPIMTGEITTPMGELHRHSGGLDDIYASHSPIDTTYAVLNGDEYPVIFGIDTVPFKAAGHYVSDSGDGVRLGGRVGLEHVTSHIVPYEKLPEMQAWSADNCEPDAITMSWEAAYVINHLR